MAKNISGYYWCCQIMGWGLLSIMFIILNLISNSYGSVKLMEKMIALFFSGITTTHIFRNVILKYKWLMLPFKKGLPWLFFGLTITSFMAGFIRVTGYGLTTVLISKQQFILSARLIYVSSIECAFFIIPCTLIYYFYCYLEKTRKERLEKIRLELIFKEMKLQSAQTNVDIHHITDLLNQIQILIDENPTRARAEITEFSNLLRKAHFIIS